MSEPIVDLDVVALLTDIPEESLERGQVGTIVLTHNNGEAFEVEFIFGSSNLRRPVVATIGRADLLKLKDYKYVPVAMPA